MSLNFLSSNNAILILVLVRKVCDVWEWLNCMPVDLARRLESDTSEAGAVMSRCGFRSVRYLEVKYVEKTLWDQG